MGIDILMMISIWFINFDSILIPILAFLIDCDGGYILLPLLYKLFTSDLPDIVHNHPLGRNRPPGRNIGEPCVDECGENVVYIDDCTYTYTSKDAEDLSRKLSTEYEKVSKYMNENNLVLNNDKTHLIV